MSLDERHALSCNKVVDCHLDNPCTCSGDEPNETKTQKLVRELTTENQRLRARNQSLTHQLAASSALNVLTRPESVPFRC